MLVNTASTCNRGTKTGILKPGIPSPEKRGYCEHEIVISFHRLKSNNSLFAFHLKFIFSPSCNLLSIATQEYIFKIVALNSTIWNLPNMKIPQNRSRSWTKAQSLVLFVNFQNWLVSWQLLFRYQKIPKVQIKDWENEIDFKCRQKWACLGCYSTHNIFKYKLNTSI